MSSSQNRAATTPVKKPLSAINTSLKTKFKLEKEKETRQKSPIFGGCMVPASPPRHGYLAAFQRALPVAIPREFNQRNFSITVLEPA